MVFKDLSELLGKEIDGVIVSGIQLITSKFIKWDTVYEIKYDGSAVSVGFVKNLKAYEVSDKGENVYIGDVKYKDKC